REIELVDAFFDQINQGVEPGWTLSKEDQIERRIFAKLQQSINQQEKEPIQISFIQRYNSVIRTVAASILILLTVGLFYFSLQPQTDFITAENPKGKRSILSLADG